jgi:capsular polysaccharide transport system permease protein
LGDLQLAYAQVLKKWKAQGNTLKALTIHQLQGQMSTYRYGFAWVLLEPLIFIAAFRMMRKFFGAMAQPSGMTPLMFYVLGVFPIFMFFDGLRTYAVAASRSKLLDFPTVSPLDLMIAKNVASFSVYFILFWVLAVTVSNFESAWPPENVLKIMFALLACWILGQGVGLAVSGAYLFFPPLKQFIGYTNFVVRMISGMFFCITMIPVTVWPYLTWNPLLHLTEIARDAWFESYVSPIANPGFVLECVLGTTLLGLLVERSIRRVPKI